MKPLFYFQLVCQPAVNWAEWFVEVVIQVIWVMFAEQISIGYDITDSWVCCL